MGCILHASRSLGRSLSFFKQTESDIYEKLDLISLYNNIINCLEEKEYETLIFYSIKVHNHRR